MTTYFLPRRSAIVMRLDCPIRPVSDNDNLPPTDQNFATRFAVCAEGVARGIIAVENDD